AIPTAPPAPTTPEPYPSLPTHIPPTSDSSESSNGSGPCTAGLFPLVLLPLALVFKKRTH
ncbi:MAG: hypothetical protein JW726_03955, partial [Anaerolineales bacterium]|nr:hypothetical protein [Anaerolineales bacterium]